MLSTCRQCLAALLMAFAGLGPAWAAAEATTSNIELLGEAAAQATDNALAELTAAPGSAAGPVLLQSGTRHKGNWLVEQALAERLLERGFRVTLDSLAAAGKDRLAYRVLDLRVTGRSGLLSGTVQRQAEATVALSLSRDDALVWQGEYRAVAADRIPRNRVDLLGNTDYPFAKTDLTAQSWSRFAEPMIVSGVLGGLVYLFFSNR